jgi:pyrroline-5-carboxylate reductase
MKTVILGGGVMGEAILSRALEQGVLNAREVTVCEKIGARRAHLQEQYGVDVAGDTAVCGTADVVLLAVKPQDLPSAAQQLKPQALLISIAAGLPFVRLHKAFSCERIIRVMPNTPAAIGAGMSVWTATNQVSEAQREQARAILAAVGRERYVDDERKLDMATALSGSGPGYVFLILESMIDGGVSVGLTRAEAEELALQTLYGSALYAKETGVNPAELRARVTSPAGTTAAGLLELERGGLRAAIIDAVRAAHQRARELGEQA